MKLYVFQTPRGGIHFANGVLCGDEIGNPYIGTVDLDIQKPKKTVVRDADMTAIQGLPESDNWRRASFDIPREAKNIKCTYEIEEKQ